MCFVLSAITDKYSLFYLFHSLNTYGIVVLFAYSLTNVTYYMLPKKVTCPTHKQFPSHNTKLKVFNLLTDI